jgi:hypothetical protein
MREMHNAEHEIHLDAALALHAEFLAENRQKAKLLFFSLLNVQRAEQTRTHLSGIISCAPR